MKTYNNYKLVFFILLTTTFFCSCHSYKNLQTVDTQNDVIDSSKNEDFYSVIQKNYKNQNGQGYTRITERNYFGLQNEAPSTFKQFDVKKGININHYNKYSLASFFAPGIYTIPDDTKSIAYDIFAPIIDSIFQYTEKDTFLHGEIVILGYSDETPVSLSSPSYKMIAALQNKASLTEKEYKNYLSYLRAKEVYDIITKLYSDKMDKLTSFSKVLIDISAEGRGIEYPDATKNYKLVDEKRRITKVYWRVY